MIAIVQILSYALLRKELTTLPKRIALSKLRHLNVEMQFNIQERCRVLTFIIFCKKAKKNYVTILACKFTRFIISIL